MFELPINEEANNRENRKKVLGIVLDILDKNDVKYKIDIDNRTRYLASIPNLIGETDLYITTNINDNREICKQANFKIAKYGALLTHNNLNILKLTVADEMPYEESNTEYDDEFMNTKIDLKTLLDNQDHKRIFLSSDWHFFQTHYKHEANPVNTQKIVTWCKENIKDDDIFMYLGDISFRYANKQDQEESQKILKTIPGIKVLIIGNHDGMLGQEYFTGCGFDYVFEEFTWNNYIFTHRPINMSLYADEMLNIHGHIHKWPKYNTTDGKRNINVYPWYFNNKPVTLDYIEHHVEDLVKDHEWNKSYMLGESTVEADELVDTILSNLRTLTKQTKSLEETKRSELPDSAFGIPEDRKYPLDTEQHVRSAIKLFGHAEESKKKELAKRIKRAADKYGIDIPETTQVYKYLHESVFDNELVLSEIMSDINSNFKSILKEEYTENNSILDEWSMAACNPIIGVHKPFILKIGLDSGSVINTKQYAFSPDIISDKYLVVNEDAHFSIVDKSYFDDKVIESVYEYKGNRLFKLAEAYKNNSIVDNTVFYTALTGKPMLTEDQIDFDSNFSKVDISRYEQEVLTDLATNKDAYLETVGRGSEYNAPVLEEAYIDKIPYVNTYHRDDIVVKEDFDGYYFYNTITKRRTSSAGTITNLTETMLKTVM